MTAPAHLLDTVAALANVDVAAFTGPDEIETFVRSVAAVRSWTDALLTRAAARADELATLDGKGPGGEHAVRNAARLTHHQAAAVARRSGIVDRFTRFATALNDGTISGEHLDVLARVVPHLTPTALPEFAAAEADLLTVGGSYPKRSPGTSGPSPRWSTRPKHEPNSNTSNNKPSYACGEAATDSSSSPAPSAPPTAPPPAPPSTTKPPNSPPPRTPGRPRNADPSNGCRPKHSST